MKYRNIYEGLLISPGIFGWGGQSKVFGEVSYLYVNEILL